MNVLIDDGNREQLTINKKIIFLAVVGIALFLGILLSFRPLLVAGGIAFFGGLIVFLLKKEIAIYLIILTLFFEADVFSFELYGARIRSSQIIASVALVVLLILFGSRKIQLKKTPLDIYLWMYIGINFLALKNSTSLNRSLKISILLLSLALLYYVVINFVTTKELFLKVFKLMVFVGLAEIAYGLYQVVAGMSNTYLGTGFSIGHSGIMQQEYLNSPWGRPYGTLFEPDWYGAIAMFFAILCLILYSFDPSKKRKLYLGGMILSLTGLFFSFVRASWVGFVCALVILVIVRNIMKLKNVKFDILYKLSFLSLLMILLVFSFSPSVNSIIRQRLAVEASPSTSIFPTRFITSKYAIKSFLKNPIFGNGPGSPIVEEGTEEYDEMVEKGLSSLVNLEYTYSLPVSLLTDIGVVGLLLFVLLFVKYVRFNIRNIPTLDSDFQIINFALFGGVLALFISYLATNGLWIPFTWVFLALNVAGIKVAQEHS